MRPSQIRNECGTGNTLKGFQRLRQGYIAAVRGSATRYPAGAAPAHAGHAPVNSESAARLPSSSAIMQWQWPGSGRGGLAMKASVDGRVIAQSDDIVACAGYQYFPRAAVRMDWLEKVAKTEHDLGCPPGVQFYDVVVDGQRHQAAGL